MNTRRIAVAIAIALAVPLTSPILAADQTAANPPAAVQKVGGYLGVMLGPVPAVLRSQLSDVLPAGQGVMVRDVVEGSPAAKAGLQPYDILVSYGDQKLFSADQLSQLVYTDGADQPVTLKVIHNGATNERQVVLGAAQPDAYAESPRAPAWIPRQHNGRHPMAPFFVRPPGQAEDNWETFDSLSLQKGQDGSYQAEIQYLDADGRLQTHQFTGSRDEIRDQILRQQGLPQVERDQLLDALSARDNVGPMVGPLGRQLVPPPWFNWQPGF